MEDYYNLPCELVSFHFIGYPGYHLDHVSIKLFESLKYVQ